MSTQETTRVRLSGGPADGQVREVLGFRRHIVVLVPPATPWGGAVEPEKVIYTFRGLGPEGEPVFTP